MATPKKVLFCIPGLGGHPSVFNEYVDLLPEYELRLFEFVNRARTLATLRAAIRKEDQVVLFCHCYSSQMGIQLALEMPEKISQLIFLEPYFVEFHSWMRIFRPAVSLLVGLMRFTDAIGWRRRRFAYQPDYVALAKYPIFIQPLFDMRWQNLTDYFCKCLDILDYRLPPRVALPTLMIFSPQGFSRNPAIRVKLKQIFPRVRFVEMQAGTHNVITMGAAPVAAAVREALAADLPSALI